MKRKLLALLLALGMAMTMLPAAAIAVGETFTVSNGTEGTDYSYSETENGEAVTRRARVARPKPARAGDSLEPVRM